MNDDRIKALGDALRPFSSMAEAMFARNWNRDGVAISLVEKDGPIRLTFGDFLAARDALAEIQKPGDGHQRALRITGPNGDGEYWLHIEADGRSGGINLGSDHGPICKRLLDAASETPARREPLSSAPDMFSVVATMADRIDTSPAAIAAIMDWVTPGPWRVGPVDDCRVEDANGNEVSQIDGDYNHPDLWPIMEANARFIAAARELVPALAAERDELRAANDALTNALRAIAEAQK